MKKIIIIIAVVVIAILGFIGYSGLFTSVAITEEQIGPYTMVVKKHMGSYYKTKATFEEVEAMLKKNIDTKKLKGVGFYYDDPAKVKEDQLRSECGFIIDKTDVDKIGKLPDGIQMREFNKTLCAVGEFPLRSFLSYMIGPARVYPKFLEYGKGKQFVADYSLEIYDSAAGKIQYCMPLKEQR